MTKAEIQELKNIEQAKILEAQADLVGADYKDHKMCEAAIRFLCDKYPTMAAALPYPLTVFDERDAFRAQINAAQERIAELDAIVPEDEDEPNGEPVENEN